MPSLAIVCRPDRAGDAELSAALRAAVTVFVTPVGAPSYAACRQHLAAQDCAFTVQEIADVAPMSAAFQRMLDTCTTPFSMRGDGFTHLVLPRAAAWRAWTVAAGILGLHGTQRTPRAIFERYATYERTRHARPTSQWALRAWTSLFLGRVMTTGSELDLFALLGVLAGRLADDSGASAKDFRRDEHLTGLTAAEAFLDELARRRR